MLQTPSSKVSRKQWSTSSPKHRAQQPAYKLLRLASQPAQPVCLALAMRSAFSGSPAVLTPLLCSTCTTGGCQHTPPASSSSSSQSSACLLELMHRHLVVALVACRISCQPSSSVPSVLAPCRHCAHSAEGSRLPAGALRLAHSRLAGSLLVDSLLAAAARSLQTLTK